MAALIGPTLGGVFSDSIGWRWIFFVNLPLGAAAMWAIQMKFHEKVQRHRHRIDYLGATLLGVGGTLLLLALLEGGVQWAWDSATSIGLFVAAVALLSAIAPASAQSARRVEVSRLNALYSAATSGSPAQFRIHEELDRLAGDAAPPPSAAAFRLAEMQSR